MNRIAEVSCPPSEYLKWLNRIVDRCEAEGNDGSSETPISADQGSSELKEQLSDIRSWDLLNQELDALADDEGHIPDLRYLTQMVGSLKRAAAIQATLLAKEQKGKEPFHGYAKFYDEVVGKSCLEDFMSGDIKLFGERCDLDMASSRLISVGCGTGIAEAFILQHFGMKKENLLGVDLSEAMVNVASTRINARAVDFMAMDAREGEWDVVFSGSNVYQYFPMNHFENAIKKTARMIRPGGYFFGDFITPDHIRWYPHIFQREDVVSLRLPKMVVKGHHLYHQNEIVNVSRKNGRLRFIDGGKHQRYLPSLLKVRLLFNEHFRGSVDFYDAVSLVPLGEDAETTLSTRYLVVARKAPNGQEPRS